MDQFDFARLTGVDFEEVCHDLLERHLGIELETFKKGKDGGVDLRHMLKGKNRLVVQCKHWENSGSAALLREIRSKEVTKIQRLDPSRYILVTTCPLSAANKSRVMDLCSPYILEPSDIIGRDEVAAMLRRYDDIVKRHLKLWLSSSTILDVVVRRDLYVRSSDLADQMSDTLKRYVQTASYGAAWETLRKEKVCVIAGDPGVGKTTLARVLCADYMAEGYKVVDISFDSNEISQIWEDKSKQIYYYDDFLGRNFLGEMLNKNEDTRLLDLMAKVRQYANKRFILTTRNYFLEHARQRYDKLDDATLNPLVCTIGASDFTQFTRAHILYNHVYYSDLPADEKVRFGELKASFPIVLHDNFNPRVIEAALASFMLTKEASSAPDFVAKSLDSPGQIWAHVVTNQLSTAAVDILEILLGLGPRVSVQMLTDAWIEYRAPSAVRDEREFQHALETLDGSMIRVQLDSDDNEYYAGYSNPSIRDYMRERCSSQSRIFQRLLSLPYHFEIVENIWLMASGGGSNAISKSIVRMLPKFVEYAKRALFSEPVSGLFLLNACSRLRTLALFSIKFKATDIDSFLLERIDELGRAPWRPLSIDINVLYFTLKMHPDPRFLAAGKRLVESAVAWLTEDLDLNDFSTLKFVRDELRELPSTTVSDETHYEIEYQLKRLTRSIIEEWMAGDLALDAYEVENIVDYVNSYDRPSDHFEGYSELLQNYGDVESQTALDDEAELPLAVPSWADHRREAGEVLAKLKDYSVLDLVEDEGGAVGSEGSP